MTPSVVVFLSALVFTSVVAVDYTIILSDQPVQVCPGKENNFFDKFFDLSDLRCFTDADETSFLDGSATFTSHITDPPAYKMSILEYKSGRWVDTGFTMNRPNICSSFFDENELWHPIVLGLPTDCPPKNGEKYEFHNRSLNIAVKNLSPGLQGLYRIVSTFTAENEELCFMNEAELVRQQSSFV